MSAKEPKKVTIIIIGDGSVGKTSILVRYAEQKFEQNDYTPTVLSKNSVPVTFSGRDFNLELIDTGGQEEFKELAKRYHDYADVFLVCFSVNLKSSLRNAPKVRIFVPFILLP